MGVDIQKMAASAIRSILNQIDQANEAVGVECLWCRATPEPNSEDIVLQEYTLTNLGLECPKPIKATMTNSDYNAGNFTVDLFGVNYDAPVELSVPITLWRSTFGDGTMPQQGDVVYIKMIHKLFEVKSSQTMYVIGSNPTVFKCQLAKYNPSASRKETKEFRASVDDLTVSQEALFGDAVSKEVADVAVEAETAYQTTTPVDPLKDFDPDSVVAERLVGPDGVLVSNAYYDFRKASRPVSYRVSQDWDPADGKLWVVSFIASDLSDGEPEEKPLRSVKPYLENSKYSYFKADCPMPLSPGDRIRVTRGSAVSLSGTASKPDAGCDCGILLRFSRADVRRAERRLTGWYKGSGLKIRRDASLPVISSAGGALSATLSPSAGELSVTFGKASARFSLGRRWKPSGWTYFALELSAGSIRAVASGIAAGERDKAVWDDLLDETRKLAVKPGAVSLNSPEAGAAGAALGLRNVRAYEAESPMGDAWKSDRASAVTRNASKLFLVDGPNPLRGGDFYSPVR